MNRTEGITLQTKRGMLSQAARAKQNLIVGLKGVQKPSGGWPTIYPNDGTTHHWTTSQCFRALIESRERPRYYREALDSLLKAKEGHGWRRGKADGLAYDSIYCTSDAIMAFLSVQQLEEVRDSLKELAKARNVDKGWGIIVGDETSRVRTTAWAIDAFLMAQRYASITRMIERVLDQRQKFADWLSESVARLDQSRAIAGGWGYSPNESQGNMSATAVTLRTLLAAKNNGFAVNRKNVTDGLSVLKEYAEKKSWVGAYETFDVYLHGKFVGRHRSFGDGAPMVLMAFTDAMKQALLPDLEEHALHTFNLIIGACESYENLPGKWLIPSSAGEKKPLVWDSAYAILALDHVRRYLLNLSPEKFRIETLNSLRKGQPQEEYKKSYYK